MKSKVKGQRSKVKTDGRYAASGERPATRPEVITLAHGSGGRKMHRLISQVFVRHFGNPMLRRLEDAAEFVVRGQGPGVRGQGQAEGPPGQLHQQS